MKKNQTLHISIKEPPNPEPVKNIAILTDPDNPTTKQFLDMVLSQPFEPKAAKLQEMTKDEVLRLVTEQSLIGIVKSGTLTAVYFDAPTSPNTTKNKNK